MILRIHYKLGFKLDLSLEQDLLTVIPEHNVEAQQLDDDFLIVQGDKDLQIWMEINLLRVILLYRPQYYCQFHIL